MSQGVLFINTIKTGETTYLSHIMQMVEDSMSNKAPVEQEADELAMAVSTNLIGAALGMLGILSPIMAGMIHIFHTGGILLNSGRLLSWEPPVEPMDQCRGCLRGCKCGNAK